jgi:hypothetical protein
MKSFAVHIVPFLFTASLILAGCSAAPAADSGGSGLERHFSIEGENLVLGDLIGTVRVGPADGSSYEIDVSIQGKDATADRIRIDEKSGDAAHLYVQFPTDESGKFVYPAMGNSNSTIEAGRAQGKDDSGNLLDWVLPGHHKSVRISGHGSGLEIWADVTVKVPKGKGIRVRHGVGTVEAEGVAGPCDLDTQSGSVTARRIGGRLRVDTGSGGVTVSEVDGDVSIDTGSGSVDAARCNGKQVMIDTGSGGVRVAEIQCNDLSIDTGSGSVEGAKIGADSAKIDTGSGGVTVDFARLGTGTFMIDTGSGTVDVHLPADASADIVAESASGGIRADLANARITHKSDDKLALVVGSGEAKFRIDTGSGGVRIAQ